jgi:hypothetical protein
MKTKLIVVADLGLLRAYRVSKGRANRQPHLELVDELRPEVAHHRIADQLTDKPGRFAKGRGPADVQGDLSAGEQHDLVLEQRRRLIKLLAGKINALLADDSIEACSLAASAPIHLQLLDELSPTVRAKITTTLARDLTKTDPVKLPMRFMKKAGKSSETAQTATRGI